MRAVELVGGAGQEITIGQLHVDEAMRGVVNRVHENERADGVRQFRRLGHVGDRADGVRSCTDRDQLGAPIDGALQRPPVQQPRLAGEGNRAERDAAFPGQRAPRRDVGVMIQLGHHHLVAEAPPPA